MKKTDEQLQHDVMAELTWEPSVDHADIGVAAVNGVVTLSGYVPSYAEKLAAEKAARRVAGVTAIAQEMKVRYPSDAKTADHEIAKRVLDVFCWNSMIPNEGIQVKVERGWVSLTGKVRWHYQSKEAARAAARISGVVGVSNDLKIVNNVSASDVRAHCRRLQAPSRARRRLGDDHPR
jgi:osmotically-inducible protein OsmY